MPRERVDTTVPAPLELAPAVAVSVHDGDTFRVALPLHYLVPGVIADGWVEDVRLAHVNAAELSTGAGLAAAQAVAGWLLPPGGPVKRLRVYVWGRDKYGRLLADVAGPDGALLSAFVASLSGTAPMSVARQLAAAPRA